MGSKRSKKPKQDVDLLTDRSKNEESTVGVGVNHVENDNNRAPSKTPKKRKKPVSGEPAPKRAKKVTLPLPETKKIKPTRRKSKVDSTTSSENTENEGAITQNGDLDESFHSDDTKNESPERKMVTITWPDEDITELINRMGSNIPEQDVLAYRSRLEKLNWENVAFKSYSAEDCKKTWLQVQKRIRRFRLLREILNDAKEWISTPRTHHKPRAKRHPDMPRRPLTSYFLFYIKVKDQVISENPGLDGSDISKLVSQIYKNLPQEEKEQYEKLAASNKEEYSEKMRIFMENHPELKTTTKTNHRVDKIVVKTEKTPKVEKPIKVEKVPKVEKPQKIDNKDKNKERGKPGRPIRHEPVIPKDRPPKKCQTPFGLYYESELKNIPVGMEKHVFRDKCKEQYKQMSEKKQLYWINLAEQDLHRYEEELKTYKAKHPNYAEQKFRSTISKKEQFAKDRASGKPIKPPNSAYALFSKSMLKSEEAKRIHPKERMNFIANKWKTSDEEEKNVYRQRIMDLSQKYKEDFAVYVESLPEDERNKVVSETTRRVRRGDKVTKKTKIKKSMNKENVTKPAKLKFQEPEQPPISPCKYFATLYNGDGDPMQAWKTLSSEEKRKYEEELVKKKQAYIVEFEKFLKSLSKEELEAFSKSRQQHDKSDEESSECSDSDDDGGDDDVLEEDDDEDNDV